MPLKLGTVKHDLPIAVFGFHYDGGGGDWTRKPCSPSPLPPDLTGNSPWKGAGYIWDLRNRLTTVGTFIGYQQVATHHYTYDAEGHLIGRQALSTGVSETESYLVNPQAALSQVLMRQNSAGTTTAPPLLGRVEYSAYGMITRNDLTAIATPFLYVGEHGVMTDRDTGLHSMRARWYHPGLPASSARTPSSSRVA